MAAARRVPRADRESVLPAVAPESRTAREAREARAKAICRTCIVREDCLAYALEIAEPHGIWGGLSEIERRALL